MVRPDFWSVAPPLTPLKGSFPTDHQRPSALGAGDSIPCSGTAVSGIQSSAWSLCRQHPEGGARGGTAEVRSKPPPTEPQSPGPSALKEAHGQLFRTHRFREVRKPKGYGTPKGVAPSPVSRAGAAEVTHSSWDLRVCQVLEVLPALRARSHSPTLGLHPHLGDQIEL